MERPKEATNVRLDPDLLDGMRRVRERVGIPVSEQIRRAIRDWLRQFDEPPATKTARKRADTRKRA